MLFLTHSQTIWARVQKPAGGMTSCSRNEPPRNAMAAASGAAGSAAAAQLQQLLQAIEDTFVANICTGAFLGLRS